jgi:hypothetical protein
MIGERLESRRHLPWVASLFLTVGLGLVVAGLVSGIKGLLAGAVLPIAIGGALWLLGRERPFAATVREEGLEIEGEGEPVLIPYASIQNIKVAGRPADPAGFDRSSAPIAVLHEVGVLHIPARLNVPSHEVLRFLAERVPDSGGRDVNPALADYLRRLEEDYGPESVATFRAASHRLPPARRGLRALSIGLVLAGAAWAVLGFREYVDVGWGGAGVACVVIGGFLYAASFAKGASSNPVLKNWKNASLVIGPFGLAMVQGNIQGELRWAELVEFRFQGKPRSFYGGHAAAIPGILLRVKGAQIVIADIYDRPLYVIYNRIVASAGPPKPLGEDL